MKSSCIEFQLLKTAESIGFRDTSRVVTNTFMTFSGIYINEL